MAAEVDGIVLEDDYDAELRYDRQPVGSLQGLAPDRVLALGSLSKTLAPGIRLGWPLVPRALVGSVVREKLLTSRGSPALDQMALATLMQSGRYDRHVRRMSEVYRQRRDALVGAVAQHTPRLRLLGLEAGCHAVLELPAGVTEDEIVQSALSHAVRVYGLSRDRWMLRGRLRRRSGGARARVRQPRRGTDPARDRGARRGHHPGSRRYGGPGRSVTTRPGRQETRIDRTPV